MKGVNAMRAIIIAAGLLLVAAGCQTTPEDPQAGAAVEDRTKPGAKPGAQPVERPQVGKLDVTKPGGASDSVAALKDPSSPLSRRQIFFDYDRFDVKDEYRPLIEAHAKYLRENPSAKMLIQGNTDERGGREYNVALGQRLSDGV
jgi:peptidoglycan-associated lipoprotein